MLFISSFKASCPLTKLLLRDYPLKLSFFFFTSFSLGAFLITEVFFFEPFLWAGFEFFLIAFVFSDFKDWSSFDEDWLKELLVIIFIEGLLSSWIIFEPSSFRLLRRGSFWF